jgi:2-dehydropantoate 2-reductase
MRHAVLGAGGIGGLLSAALARSGAEVVILLPGARLGAYPGRMTVESEILGHFEVDVPAASRLERPPDVLWVTTKATQLEAGLALAPPAAVGDATVVPLLNGLDHVALLRERYTDVVPGVIRVESTRIAPGHIRHQSPFVWVELAGAEPVAEDVRSAGIDCRSRDDERTMLWEKLAFLGPVALATTALDATFGQVREDARYLACQDETLAVSHADGGNVNDQGLRGFAATVPEAMKSSMQRDVEAGRPPELDAIGGAIQRAGQRQGIATPATGALVEAVERRVASSAAPG